jgi:prepilin-type N-terminal cleavage/methylation domain-containing protein/prepilin-type processing-associated H-X9-DG protein
LRVREANVRRNRAFTLIELLVVIAIIALLIGILMPALGAARRAMRTASCLSNMRNMEMAHWMYMDANNGRPIQAGLSHGGAHNRADVAWISTLEPYYGDELIARCPSDDSPHWEGGTALGGVYRRTSYGINEFTDMDLIPWGGPYRRLENYPHPVATVHFLEMAETGDFAAADHPHVDLWVGNVVYKASKHLQINQHGGDERAWDARANYGFLDGHAETLEFEDVFRDRTVNRFDPAVAF